MMQATKEQQLAINKEGSNILVSAGAGSGKTAVLTERVCRKVKEGIDIRKILVLTFTNEAAGEMKARIRSKLEEENIKDQLEYIDSAFITTFDAFSLYVVRKEHELLNISQNISIIDSSIVDLEKKRIIEEIFLELYKTKDQDFLNLIKDFTNRDDQVIKDAILNIKNSLDLIYDKENYLNTYIDKYYNEEYIDKIFQEYFLYLKEQCLEIESYLYALEDLIDGDLYTKVYEKYSKFIKPKTYNDLYKIKDKITIQFKNISEEASEIKDLLKERVAMVMELAKYSEEELKEQYRSTKTYVKAIIKIILELDKRLDEYKSRNEAYEFLDIAHMAIKIVKDFPEVRQEFKNNYNEILIDEYQDTNDLQEMFISEIENNNVYMVGDIKQSIYRFRNANPKIFKKKYSEYTKHMGGEKIDLLKNFRSREEVLNNINEIFEILMSDELGGAAYKKDQKMIYGNLDYSVNGANNNNNNMSIYTYDSVSPKFSNGEVEAFIIGKDIKDKVSSHYQVYDFKKKKNRDAVYSDFCIILDRGTEMARYKKIFEYLNIPMEVYKDSDLTVQDSLLIIKNIIGLILAINRQEYNTKMKYYFVSIARSFLSDLNDNDIFKMINDNTFYESDIYQKCYKIAKDLELKTPMDVLEEIILDFDIYERLILVGDVDAEINRLDYLKDLVLNMEDLGFTIQDEKEYLEQMIEGKAEIRYKEARMDVNCVKIMNIHKSKGLQFPICYFAGLDKDFNLRDMQSRFMFSLDYGILTPFYKEGIGTTFVKELIKDNYRKEEISEKIRLFYVALTRAQEKIIMVMPNLDIKEVRKEEISLTQGKRYKSFYDFMKVISGNLKPYISLIDVEKLGLTKDYNNIINIIKDNIKLEETMIFKEKNIESNLVENKHASKNVTNLVTYEEEQTLRYGTKLHEMLELTNFKEESNNKYVNNLKEKFDFKNATIYQELEFIYNMNDEEYHGIIDLMLEYDDEIKVIDYKLKNINDEEYIKQLNVYYNYIKQVSNKKISLYLYSILNNEIKELNVLQNI